MLFAMHLCDAVSCDVHACRVGVHLKSLHRKPRAPDIYMFGHNVLNIKQRTSVGCKISLWSKNELIPWSCAPSTLNLLLSQFSEKDLLIFTLCVWVFACMCRTELCPALMRARKGYWSPWNWSYGQLCGLTGAGNWTQVLSKSSQCS